MKILIAYDGTLHAKKALSYAIEKARPAGGRVTVLQVFDPSLFIDYDAGPSALALARKEFAFQSEETARLIAQTGSGVAVALLSGEGSAAELLQDQVLRERPDLLMLPPRYQTLARVFDVPVFPVPGTILVPLDGSGRGVAPGIALQEARLTGSRITLLGIVPVHLYSREEKKELEQVRRSTRAAMKRFRKTLEGAGAPAGEMLSEGYPDEEIIRAAQGSGVSLVLLPSGSTAPSELAKAGAILADEPGRLHCPLELVPEGTSA